MSFKITGKVEKVEVKKGEGNRGPYEVIGLTVKEVGKEYPQSANVSFFINEHNEDVRNIVEGDMVEIEFNLQTSEYDGRTFTNIKGWRCKKTGATPNTTTQDTTPASTPESDDLPF